MKDHPVGSVWWNDADDFVLMVLEKEGHDLRLTALILDNGVWPSPAGRLYPIHINSLHKYYSRIA